MDTKSQETMDGSPARVTRRLADLFEEGKFRGLDPGTNVAPDEGVIDIRFQAGPLQEVGVNGCSIEDVIDVLTARLEGFQRGDFRCRENALAITKLEEAKQWLLYRTMKRQQQGVEGRNQAHLS